MPAGRPSIFSKELYEKVCERLEDGESLVSITNDKEMPAYRTFCRWLSSEGEEYDQLRQRYARARELQQDFYAEEILRIAYDESRDTPLPNGNGGLASNTMAVHRDKLRVDSLKWLMSKLAPKKYGDKVTQEIKGEDGGPAILQIVTKVPDKK